ncbi:MAG: TPM domain-containing protein [candidate division FCPU426 bacterium]
MRTWMRAAAAAALLWLAPAVWGWAEMPARPMGRVSDFADVIPADKEAQIAGLLDYVKTATGAELAVVTVASLDGLAVDTYANQLFNQWGIGEKGKDNGALLLIAPNERKVRIEVGYGLEPVLTDGRCGRILDEQVLPAFKAGDYGQGALNGCAQIMTLLMNQDSLPPESTFHPQDTVSSDEPSWQMKVGIVLFFALFITIGFLALGSGLGKGGEPFFVLWGSGFGGIPLVMSIIFGLVMNFPVYILPAWAVLMFIVGISRGKKFLKAALASGHVQVNGRTYYGGGSGFGSFSSGSSSGSFGGGSSFSGGSSGGGGSSRSW